jgi:hypothetical protein
MIERWYWIEISYIPYRTFVFSNVYELIEDFRKSEFSSHWKMATLHHQDSSYEEDGSASRYERYYDFEVYCNLLDPTIMLKFRDSINVNWTKDGF